MLAVNPASLTQAAASRSLTRGLTAARASGVAHPWTSTGHSAPSGRTSASKPIKPGAVINLNRYRIDPLTITSPYEPGEGLSKNGNPRVRRMLTQLMWRWTIFQPQSALTRWFVARTGGAKGRMKKIMAVALARKLLVALWRTIEAGVIPEGARLAAA